MITGNTGDDEDYSFIIEGGIDYYHAYRTPKLLQTINQNRTPLLAKRALLEKTVGELEMLGSTLIEKRESRDYRFDEKYRIEIEGKTIDLFLMEN